MTMEEGCSAPSLSSVISVYSPPPDARMFCMSLTAAYLIGVGGGLMLGVKCGDGVWARESVAGLIEWVQYRVTAPCIPNL
jgi:hypothetical protein